MLVVWDLRKSSVRLRAVVDIIRKMYMLILGTYGGTEYRYGDRKRGGRKEGGSENTEVGVSLFGALWSELGGPGSKTLHVAIQGNLR